ncbi:MAG: IS21 family transposase [Planctomycetes bacterium]|nr:IS21 family transposase [Planctomycetota bacterium]
MKRFQIQKLREAGVSVVRTSLASGASLRTVQRVSTDEPIDDPGKHDEKARVRMGRPSKVEPYRDRVKEWLKAEPELASIALLERARLRGYRGGKSAFYEFVGKLRLPKKRDGIVRFEAVPGEFCQHDFGQHLVRYADGTQERVRFFASRLKYSRMARVQLVEDERTETVCHGVVDAYMYFGGMPLLGVFDNPRTIVTERKGKHVRWQETFAWFTTECGFSPLATWPRRPQEKGSVENLVGFCKTSFFKAHRFQDRADLEEKLEQWHHWVNEERRSRATGDVPRSRMALEAERLQPLKIDPTGFTLRYSRVVRTDGFVDLDGRRYFAGFEHVGQAITVRVGKDDLYVHLGDEVITHPRRPANGKYSVLPSQREDLLTKDGARPYIKRQLLMDLCPAAEWFMTEVRHRRPERWEEEVDRIFELLERYGEFAVRDALVEVARRNVVGAEYVVAILDGQASEAVSR